MVLIKLTQTSETGDEAGTVFVNADQIVAVRTGVAVTEVQTADGKTHWVKEQLEQVAKLAKGS